MDMATTLIVFNTHGEGILSKSIEVLSMWLLREDSFPFGHMEAIINRSGENEVNKYKFSYIIDHHDECSMSWMILSDLKMNITMVVMVMM